MATIDGRCAYCFTKLPMTPGRQTIHCPGCQTVIFLSSPAATGNFSGNQYRRSLSMPAYDSQPKPGVRPSFPAATRSFSGNLYRPSLSISTYNGQPKPEVHPSSPTGTCNLSRSLYRPSLSISAHGQPKPGVHPPIPAENPYRPSLSISAYNSQPTPGSYSSIPTENPYRSSLSFSTYNGQPKPGSHSSIPSENPSRPSLSISAYNGQPKPGSDSTIPNENTNRSSLSISACNSQPKSGMTVYAYAYGPETHRISSQEQPLPADGRKRAVLCGVTYYGHPKMLKGSINNVMYMRDLLVKKLGFPKSSIRILTEDEKDPNRIPTKRNILSALKWLVQGCQSGDSLMFYYSGHGSRVRDRDGDEIDGYDEALNPVDYETEGRIIDDRINEIIVRPLPNGVTLHAVVDTCFSGTILDLPYMCKMNREGYYKWEDHRTNVAYKGTSGGVAICLSACDDHQNSGDTTAFTGDETGALTYSFIQTLESEPGLTYGRLLLAMGKNIHLAQSQGQKETKASEIQEPQLSCSNKFDIHSKQFSL